MPPDQLALSPTDSEAVRQLAQRMGRNANELLHEAITSFIQRYGLENERTLTLSVEDIKAAVMEFTAPELADFRVRFNEHTARP